MGATDQPAAWIISKPRWPEMRRVRRLFAAVSRAPVGAPSLNVPHLTLEVLYPPLPDLESLKRALVEVARRGTRCQVPAVGVVREENGAVTIELALTPELVALRRALTSALARAGASTYQGPIRAWHPHLTVVSNEDQAGKGSAPLEPDPAVSGYSFPVDSLTLSLPTETPGQFREIGPYRLGEVDAASARR